MPMPLSGLALTLSQEVKDVQNQIVNVQKQLASGTKTLNPAESGVVTRLSAQADAYSKVENNISNAKNVIAVGQTALQSIADILTQMKSLANQATSAGFTLDDTTSLNQTFTALATQVANLGTGASVNGNNLLSGSTGIAVTTGIDGASASQTTVAGVNVTQIASTAAALSITQGNSGASLVSTLHDGTSSTVAGVDATAGTAAVDTILVTLGTFTNANTYTLDFGQGVGKVVFTGTSAGTAATATQIAQLIQNYINTGITGYTLGTMSAGVSAQGTGGGGLSTIQGKYTVTQDGSGTITVTQKTGSARTGTQTGVYSIKGTSGGADANIVTSTNTTPGVAYAAGTPAVDKVTFSTLTNGQSITVGGLTFTAGGSVSAASVALAYYNYVQLGQLPASTVGAFSGNSYATMHSLYDVGSGVNTTAPNGTSDTAIYFQAKGSGVSSMAVSTGTSVENARNAISSLTTLINTVSSGQASLSASNAGLTATLGATQALKSGLQNTVDTIQNIDATAMQAKLQQLNNQQSIDYYLVSQMNTEAAAILSIFR
jgi:flagellin-like hook-associated protein FlgL